MKLTVHVPTERYTLANGLQVLLHVDHRAPYVQVVVRYDVGKRDDPPGRAGLAHLYEHLMFAAAKHMSPDDYLGTLDRSGARDFNGATRRDDTVYYETVPTASLEIALFLEAERMGFARDAITSDQIERERRIVREEYHQSLLDRPYGSVRDFALQGLYPPDHPYYASTLDRDHDALQITTDDIQRFGATYYVPNDATLVLAGDIDADHVKGLVAKYFGALSAGKEQPPPRRVLRPLTARVHQTNVIANVVSDRTVLAWTLPGTTEDGFREHVVAARLLAKAVWARIGDREQSSLSPGLLSSEFILELTPRLGPLEELVSTYDTIQISLSTAPQISSWHDQQSAILSESFFSLEELDDRSLMLLDYERRLGIPDGAMLDMQAYQDLTLPRIQRAMAETFDSAHAAIVYVRRDAAAPVAGEVVP